MPGEGRWPLWWEKGKREIPQKAYNDYTGRKGGPRRRTQEQKRTHGQFLKREGCKSFIYRKKEGDREGRRKVRLRHGKGERGCLKNQPTERARSPCKRDTGLKGGCWKSLKEVVILKGELRNAAVAERTLKSGKTTWGTTTGKSDYLSWALRSDNSSSERDGIAVRSKASTHVTAWEPRQV